MIAPVARSRSLYAALPVSAETRSRLFLALLVVVVVAGFAGSILAPVLFPSVFEGVHIEPSDLTPFMSTC